MKKIEKILNFFIYIFPICYLFKNSLINLNIFIICVLGIIVHQKNLFKIKENKNIYFLFLIFFLYLIIISFYSYIYHQEINSINIEHFLKSIYFLRYFLLILVLSSTIHKNNFNIKYFLVSASIASLILVFDIIISFSLNNALIEKNLINNFSIILGEEMIGGNFLQKFSLFFLISLALFRKQIFFLKKESLFIFYFILFTILIFISILLTQNRIPLIIYTASIVILMIFQKKFRKYLIFFLTFSFISILLILDYSPRLKSLYSSFVGNTKSIILNAPELFYTGKVSNKDLNFGSGHLITFNSGVQLWKKNKIFGQGIKSFRLNCTVDYKYNVCTTHPHNYLIEILTDTGLIGFALFYLGIFLMLKNYLNIFIQNTKNYFNIYNIVFIVILFEFFPIRSTGSFFSTYNASYIFFMLPFLLKTKQTQYRKINI